MNKISGICPVPEGYRALYVSLDEDENDYQKMCWEVPVVCLSIQEEDGKKYVIPRVFEPDLFSDDDYDSDNFVCFMMPSQSINDEDIKDRAISHREWKLQRMKEKKEKQNGLHV